MSHLADGAAIEDQRTLAWIACGIVIASVTLGILVGGLGREEKTKEHKRFELVEGLVTMAEGKTLTDKEKASLWDLARDFVVNGDPLENATQ